MIFNLFFFQSEMEKQRKQEEAERLRLEEEDRKAALFLQAQLEQEVKEDTQYRQQLEQERRDHELALRLAQESNGQIDESPTLSRKYVDENSYRFSGSPDDSPQTCTKYKKISSCVYKKTFRFRLKIQQKSSEKKLTQIFFNFHSISNIFPHSPFLQWHSGLGIKQSQSTHQVCFLLFPKKKTECLPVSFHFLHAFLHLRMNLGQL